MSRTATRVRPPSIDFEEPVYLSVRKAAEEVGRSVRTVNRWIANCDLPARKGPGKDDPFFVREDHLHACVRMQERRLADGCRKPRLRNRDQDFLVRSA